MVYYDVAPRIATFSLALPLFVREEYAAELHHEQNNIGIRTQQSQSASDSGTAGCLRYIAVSSLVA